MRVLVVSHSLPFPPSGGGELRTAKLTEALAERHEVTFVGFAHGDAEPPEELPFRVVPVAWEWPPLYRAMRGDDPEAAAAAATALSAGDGEPWFASVLESPAMEASIADCAVDADVALVEHADMARFLPVLPSAIPTILDFQNVYSRMATRAQSGADEGESVRTYCFERAAARACSLALACSDVDAAWIRGFGRDVQVAVIRNGVDTGYFTAQEESPYDEPSLLFTGKMDYAPNVEGAAYLVERILPLVRAKFPDASLDIVGADPTADVLALAGDHVRVVGHVPDMRPFHRDAAVVVVPLLNGGGTRLKILEAAACGKAIVTTSVGVEGLGLRAGIELLVADTPEEFAAAVVSLLNDPRRRGELGARARTAALPYDWRGIGAELCAVVDRVARPAPLTTAHA